MVQVRWIDGRWVTRVIGPRPEVALQAIAPVDGQMASDVWKSLPDSSQPRHLLAELLTHYLHG